MPTRETHPIDDLFRRNLADSEASPPPEVWEGIQRARRSDRRFPLWFRMNGILLLIVPAAALVTYLAWPEQADPPHHAVHSTFVVPAQGTTDPVEGAADEAMTASRAVLTSGVLSEALSENDVDRMSATAPRSAGNDEFTSTFAVSRSGTQDLSDPSARVTTSLEQDRAASYGGSSPVRSLRTEVAEDRSNSPVISHTSATASDDVLTAGAIRFMRPLEIRSSILLAGASPERAVVPPPYVLPRAEWVISALFGSYDAGRSWHGNNSELIGALSRAEARTTTTAFGASLGRHWHSGFGITAGLLTERSEQQFQFVDKRTEVTEEVVTYLVTLNSQVFVSDADTLYHYETSEHRHEGSSRRSVLRIPVDGHFHRNCGRFTYGIRAGFALEFTTVDQARSLTLDRNEGRIGVAELGGAELRKRHPVMLLANAGIDLGYTINEQWSLGLNPTFMAGAAPLSPVADAWASPSRFGFQFRLSHHLIPKRSK